MENDIPYWRTEKPRWNLKVLERSAHEDAGRVTGSFETALTVGDQNGDLPLGEDASALQAGESPADDDYVESLHGAVPIVASCDRWRAVATQPYPSMMMVTCRRHDVPMLLCKELSFIEPQN